MSRAAAVQPRAPSAGQPAHAAVLPVTALDQLMPFHLWLCSAGRIRHAGPTLRKLCEGAALEGRPMEELFELRRPHHPQGASGLGCHDGAQVVLARRGAAGLTLRGLLVGMGDGDVLLDLSPGIGIVEAVARHGLSVRDFAASDPTVEMLYLIEAQGLIRDELRRLTDRLAEAHHAAEAQAVTDALTGLGNRRAMDQAVAALAQDSADEPFALLQIDLDRFKTVNDTLGHAAGDHVLQHIADVLREETRTGDLVMRTGGDEFVVICRNCADPARVATIAERIITRLIAPIPFEGRPCRIGCSIGAALSVSYAPPDLRRMMADADAALYAVKEAGRGRFLICTPPRSQLSA